MGELTASGAGAERQSRRGINLVVPSSLLKGMRVVNSAKALTLGAALVVAVVIPGCTAPAGPVAEVVEGQDYEQLDDDLEPFRSDFNEASDHVRAVLLVGPT